MAPASEDDDVKAQFDAHECSRGAQFRMNREINAQASPLAMPERNLRIVKRQGAGTVGVCEACSEQFRSCIHPRSQAEWDIKILFERHKCRTLAERTVGDLTEQIRGESDPKRLGELVIAINLLLNAIEEQVARLTGQQPPLRH